MQIPYEADVAIRATFRAVVGGDRAALAQSALPCPDVDALFARPFPPELRAQLLEQIPGMQVSGRDVSDDRVYAHAYFRGLLHPVVVVRDGARWRMDLRWWASAAKGPNPMHAVAREFLFAMISCDEERLPQLAYDRQGLEILLRERPPAGELAQVAHVCQEMQLAELEVGERFPNLIGGTDTVTQKHRDLGIHVLIGLFNGGEMPFLMRQKDGEWKVIPFHFLRAAAGSAGGTAG